MSAVECSGVGRQAGTGRKAAKQASAMMWVPRAVDVRRTRLLLGAAAVGACALMVILHGEQHLMRVAVAFSGGLFATFLYAPIQHIHVSARTAPTVGAIAALFSLVPFIVVAGYSDAVSGLSLVVSFGAGGVLFGGMLIADRMRSIGRENP